MLVRQDDVPWQGRVVIVVDVRHQVHVGESLERVVSAAASDRCAPTSRRGDHVRVLGTAGYDSGDGSGVAHLDTILEHLAVVERSRAGGLRHVLDLVGRGTTDGALAVITGRPVPGDIDAVDRVAVRGARRIVAFTDDRDLGTGGRRTTELVRIGSAAPFGATWDAATPRVAGRGRRRARRPVGST